MKVQNLCSILVLLGILSYAQAVNIKTGGASLQHVKSRSSFESEEINLAQKKSEISVDESS